MSLYYFIILFHFTLLSAYYYLISYSLYDIGSQWVCETMKPKCVVFGMEIWPYKDTKIVIITYIRYSSVPEMTPMDLFFHSGETIHFVERMSHYCTCFFRIHIFSFLLFFFSLSFLTFLHYRCSFL